jgi:hypothetical protein
MSVRKIRADNKIQKNDVVVLVAPSQGSSAFFQVRISRDGNLKSEVQHRFAPFRDLHTAINGDNACDRLTGDVKFPETLAKSSWGRKLSNEEVEDRRSKLDQVSHDSFG